MNLRMLFVWLYAMGFLGVVSDLKADEFSAARSNPVRDKAHVRYAQCFAIAYEGDIKIVDVTQPWPGASESFRYVLIPKGTPVPKAYAQERIIRVPIQNIAVLSTTHLPHLKPLGLYDALIAVSNPNGIYDPDLRGKVEAGHLPAIGRGSQIDLERVLQLNPDLVMAVGHANGQYNAHPALQSAGVPVVINAEYVEPTLLGRTEWLKFTAAFFDQEALAEQIFDDIVAQYARYADLTKGLGETAKPTVFGGALFRGTWYVAGGKSYVAQLIAEAGARYVWAHDATQGSLPLDFEAVYEKAATADVWLIGRNPWDTRSDMLQEDARYSAFKAFQNGQIYNFNARLSASGANDYWETGLVEPHLILADLIHIFHPHILPDHILKYYRKIAP